jgi:predicted ribosome quality control (RQC) complex YloA/Tae2 family protein
MALTAIEIADVVAEMGPALSGGRIQKVFQPGTHAVTLQVRTGRTPGVEPARTLTLLLCTEPAAARLHLVTGRRPNPAAPPPFCQYLRAHVEGGRIERITQLGGDRVVRIAVRTAQGPVALIAELIGRRADLLVVDAQDVIRAALHDHGHRVGEPYAAPVMLGDSRSEREESRPAGRFRTSDVHHKGAMFPRSAAIEQHYAARDQASSLERQRGLRLQQLRRRIKKVRRHAEALRSDLEAAARYKDYMRYGDLLKANLASIRKGQAEVAVVDYFDPAMPDIVIPLDPAKTSRRNMEEYFRKYRKYVTTEQEVLPRLREAEEELLALQSELSAVQQETWQPPLAEPVGASRVGAASRAPRPTGREASTSRRAAPFRRFLSADGAPIYVGRNARENEELTFGLARSDDLWLHARGVPGSHVVVRLERGSDPPPETLRDAATLALVYSDLKRSGKGEVIYTRRKYVRKMKGQPPGTVTVTQEKAVFLQLDRLRLDRLKQTQGR